ncbi:MAG: hypothetical protein ABI947_05690 [Chloroflexota bacterium]
MIGFAETEHIELNFRQRWASYLTIIVAVLALAGGYALRVNSLNATQRFENKQIGLAARYPVNWLLEEGKTDFVFRVQDPAAVPFKTTLQMALLPFGPDALLAEIPNYLNITRATSLSTYIALQINSVTLPNGTQGLQMEYAYAASETNPALQSVPIVVRGLDVIVLRNSQALVITYRADVQSFDRNRHYFDSFLRSLEF